MNSRLTEVRVPSRFCFDFVADAFELSLAHRCEILTLGSGSRLFVEVNRDTELAPQPFSARPSKRDAVIHRHSGDRDERDHIGRSHPRVLAGVLVQVYQIGGLLSSGDGGVYNTIRRRNKCDY